MVFSGPTEPVKQRISRGSVARGDMSGKGQPANLHLPREGDRCEAVQFPEASVGVSSGSCVQRPAPTGFEGRRFGGIGLANRFRDREDKWQRAKRSEIPVWIGHSSLV